MVFWVRKSPVFARNAVFCGENDLVLGEKWYFGEKTPYFWGEVAILCEQRHVLGREWYFGEKASWAES